MSVSTMLKRFNRPPAVAQQIEKTPKELQVSDASSMLRLWESVYVH